MHDIKNDAYSTFNIAFSHTQTPTTCIQHTHAFSPSVFLETEEINTQHLISALQQNQVNNKMHNYDYRFLKLTNLDISI